MARVLFYVQSSLCLVLWHGYFVVLVVVLGLLWQALLLL